MPTLAVVGAGPKGIAIAAKARAVAAAGLAAPRVVLVERGAVAGNWSGRQGYTSGLLPLGTPAEKDVGFPYADSWGTASPAVTAVMAGYSWQRHLVAQGAYADWVDRGRLRPTHRQWSYYLREVAERAEAEIVPGEVAGLEAARRAVAAGAEGGGGDLGGRGGVHRRGPADQRPRPAAQHPRVFDGRSYWLAERTFDRGRRERLRDRQRRNRGIDRDQPAGQVAQALDGRRADQPRGPLSRGESYEENRFYSEPGDWPHLAEAHRREFLERTDRGVFSSQAEAILNASHGFRTLAGRAVRIEAGQQQVVVTIEYGRERERVAYDAVVVAIGFQARWFEGLLGAQARGRLASALAGEELDRRIDIDLSIAGLSPPLHLPMVAGLAQGPGFPNLSCLGLLSDRVLRRYVPLEEPAPAAAPVAAPVAAERRERV